MQQTMQAQQLRRMAERSAVAFLLAVSFPLIQSMSEQYLQGIRLLLIYMQDLHLQE